MNIVVKSINTISTVVGWFPRTISKSICNSFRGKLPKNLGVFKNSGTLSVVDTLGEWIRYGIDEPLYVLCASLFLFLVDLV